MKKIIDFKAFTKDYLAQSLDMLKGEKTFKSIYESAVIRHKGKLAFEFYDYDGKFTLQSYKTTAKNVHRYASLIDKELKDEKKNSIVVLKLGNSPLWIEMFWAILMAGFRPLLINAKISKRGTSHLAAQARAVAVVTDDPFKYEVKKINADDLSVCSAVGGFTEAWANEIIFCSSGTTGDVKMVIYNGESMCHQIAGSSALADDSVNLMYPPQLGPSKALAMVPFHHIFGFVAVFLWFTFYGKTIVFPSSMNSKEIMELCVKRFITHVYSVPLFWDSIATQFERKKEMSNKQEKKVLDALIDSNINKGPGLLKLVEIPVKIKLLGNSVRFCISGGGYLNEKTAKIINGIGYPLHNGFGMTEIGVTGVDLNENVKDRMACSVGKPFHGVTYRIDDNGELLVKTPVAHYKDLINGEEFPTQFTEDGYFRTGDIASLDERGQLYIRGRIKDIIINADGENVFPDELELYFKGIKDFLLYCVAGIKDKDDERKEKVCLIAQVNESITVEDMERIKKEVDKISLTLPKGTRIEGIYYTFQPLPMANNMKVKRMVIKKAIEADSPDYFTAVAKKAKKKTTYSKEVQTAIIDPLVKIFSEVLLLPEERIQTDSHWINDLGGDSMNYFELVQRISERFNTAITEDLYPTLNTIDDFAKLIINNKDTI